MLETWNDGYFKLKRNYEYRHMNAQKYIHIYKKRKRLRNGSTYYDIIPWNIRSMRKK